MYKKYKLIEETIMIGTNRTTTFFKAVQDLQESKEVFKCKPHAESGFLSPIEGNYRGMAFKEEWLEEVEDGPVNAEQAWKDYGEKACYSNPILFKDGFKAGEKNHAKRVQPVIDVAKKIVELYESCGALGYHPSNAKQIPYIDKLKQTLKQLEIVNENN